MDLPRLKASLKLHEGFRGKPYQDTAGYWTIGYGHNLDANPLTPEQGEWFLDADLATAGLKAINLVTNWGDLNDARQNVLIEMVFNLGYPGVFKFKDMRAALDDHDYAKAAAAGLDSEWATQVGHRAIELMHQLETGEWA